MKIAAVITFALCVSPLLCVGQSGSQQYYEQLAHKLKIEGQNRSIEAEFAWRSAKKLTITNRSPGPQPVQGESMNIDTMEEGDVGMLSYWRLKVVSIIDDKNVLLDLLDLDLGTTKTIWLEGYPTTGLVDGESVRIIDLVQATGTKSYKTVVGGSRTVKSVKMLPPEEQKKIEKAEADAIQKTLDARYEKYHSSVGTTVEAIFLRYKTGRIELETKDGRILKLPFSAFSKESADKLREKIKTSR